MDGLKALTQDERRVAREKLGELFKAKDGKIANKHALAGIKAARDNELIQAEFEQLEWAELEAIMGADVMKQRFVDQDGDGKVTMRDVWLKLDTNQDSTITPDEFIAECLGEAFCTEAEALEAYDILRDQNE